MEHPEVVRMERKVVWWCPVELVPLLSWVSWRSKSMHHFLLPLTPRLSSSPAKAKGQKRTDEQHRVFTGIEALCFGVLSPGGNARDNDGEFANRQEVGLTPLSAVLRQAHRGRKERGGREEEAEGGEARRRKTCGWSTQCSQATGWKLEARKRKIEEEEE
jgi:hypothetical protein